MRSILNIKIIFLDVEPSNSIVEWKNLWETSNNIPCGITDDGLYYVIVDYMVLPMIANRTFYEIFMAIKDFCIRNVPPTTDCPKMDIYCDLHGRFYADANKEKPLVLFRLWFLNSHCDCLDLDRNIMKSLQPYTYADVCVESDIGNGVDFHMLLPYFIDNVLVIDILYKIFSLKILEFNSINNSSLCIERVNYIGENRVIFFIQDDEKLRYMLKSSVPNPNI